MSAEQGREWLGQERAVTAGGSCSVNALIFGRRRSADPPTSCHSPTGFFIRPADSVVYLGKNVRWAEFLGRAIPPRYFSSFRTVTLCR